MKIIKTTLGWEIQPESDDEYYHLSWLMDQLRDTTRLSVPIVEDANAPVGMMVTSDMLQRAAQEISCPRCFNYGCYNGQSCAWCGYRSVPPPPEVRTFTTKGPVE